MLNLRGFRLRKGHARFSFSMLTSTCCGLFHSPAERAEKVPDVVSIGTACLTAGFIPLSGSKGTRSCGGVGCRAKILRNNQLKLGRETREHATHGCMVTEWDNEYAPSGMGDWPSVGRDELLTDLLESCTLSSSSLRRWALFGPRDFGFVLYFSIPHFPSWWTYCLVLHATDKSQAADGQAW